MPDLLTRSGMGIASANIQDQNHSSLWNGQAVSMNGVGWCSTGWRFKCHYVPLQIQPGGQLGGTLGLGPWADLTPAPDSHCPKPRRPRLTLQEVSAHGRERHPPEEVTSDPGPCSG